MVIFLLFKNLYNIVKNNRGDVVIDNVKQIIEKNKKELAFIIGNGINRYKEIGLSWEKLLLQLWECHVGYLKNGIPLGMSFTEFFDLLVLKSSEHDENITLTKMKQQICSKMKGWKYCEHHTNIVKFAMNNNIPILTTNFDDTMEKSNDLEFFSLLKDRRKGFSDYYPWNVYFSDKKVKNVLEDFGIYHINGMVKYKRSLRLGLTDYMGSVEKSRPLIRESLKDPDNWNTIQNWLPIIFNKSLFIFGLSLNENEVFLRWLLIERAKFFKKYPEKKKKAWYVFVRNSGDDMYSGKKFFLTNVGFEILSLDTFQDLYEKLWQ